MKTVWHVGRVDRQRSVRGELKLSEGCTGTKEAQRRSVTRTSCDLIVREDRGRPHAHSFIPDLVTAQCNPNGMSHKG